MKAKKKIIAILASSIICMQSVTAITANAVSTQFTIDNDPTSSSGYTGYGNGFSYMSNSSCYNGDARYAPGDASYTYSWKHSKVRAGSGGTLTATLQVYLNHSSFSASNVNYSIYVNGTPQYVGWINQNTAPGGWNYISSRYNNLGNGSYSEGALVRADGSSPGYTGADAIKITYSW